MVNHNYYDSDVTLPVIEHPLFEKTGKRGENELFQEDWSLNYGINPNTKGSAIILQEIMDVVRRKGTIKKSSDSS